MLPARRGKPIRPAPLDELDELIFVFGEVAAEGLLFVGRIDGDRADGALGCARLRKKQRTVSSASRRADFVAMGTPYTVTLHAATTRTAVREVDRRMRRCVTQRDGFAKLALAIGMITATTCKFCTVAHLHRSDANAGPGIAGIDRSGQRNETAGLAVSEPR
jgi:hypothetical protein